MIERAIENWLINTNERSYQIPLCQVLISRGFEILYISPHGQLEFGKDIIAKSPSGEVHAYQLKGGKQTLTKFRKDMGEMYQLIDTPCDHPNVDKKKPHKSFLVANGDIADDVFQTINKINSTETHFSKLETINKDQLLKMFLDKKGAFLPQSFESFSKFLELFREDGTSNFPKKKFFDFIQNNILVPEGQNSKKLNSIFSSVILTNTILNNFESKDNCYAKFETWTILYFTLMGFIEKEKLSDKKIDGTMELIRKEILENMNKITDEFLKKDNLIEGTPLGDGDLIYKARATMILGIICCNKTYFNPDFDEKLHEKIINNLKHLWFGGECFFPHLFFVIKYLEKNNLAGNSKTMIKVIIKTILKHNGFRNMEQALPSPYYDIDTIIKSNYSINTIDLMQFKSNSFILGPLVEIAARRGLRGFLEENWRKISHMQVSKFISDQDHELFYFWNKKGINYSNFLKQTQSWKELQTNSKAKPSSKLLIKNKKFLPYFFMVYPHRISEELVNILDI